MSAAQELQVTTIQEHKQTIANMVTVARISNGEVELLVSEEEANQAIEAYNKAAYELGQLRKQRKLGAIQLTEMEIAELQEATDISVTIKNDIVVRLKEHLAGEAEPVNPADEKMAERIFAMIERATFSQLKNLKTTIAMFGVNKPKVKNGIVSTNHGYRINPSHPVKEQLWQKLYEVGLEVCDKEVEKCQAEIDRLQESGQTAERAVKNLELAQEELTRMINGTMKHQG